MINWIWVPIKPNFQFFQTSTFLVCNLLSFAGQQESGFSSMKSENGGGNWSAPESAPQSAQVTPQKPREMHSGAEMYSLSTDPVIDLNQVTFLLGFALKRLYSLHMRLI